MNVYNEIDPFAADWLESLIANGLIPPGRVERRSIAELQGGDLEGATQVHLFAGIAGWSEALRLAGIPDDFPVWSGSCPCQPFSSAGKRQGTADERHLWPEMFRLVRECRPAAVVGEQVAGGAGWTWCAGVRADLEGIGYRFRACELPACGVGAPHRRQRLFWVADDERQRLRGSRHDMGAASGGSEGAARERERLRVDAGAGGAALAVADGHSESGGLHLLAGESRDARVETVGSRAARPLGDAEHSEPGTGDAGGEGGSRLGRGGLADDGAVGRVGDASVSGPQRHGGTRREHDATGRQDEERHGAAAGAWADCWLAHCRDGKSRRVGTGIHPLAHGIPRGLGRGEPELRSLARRARANRVGRLKAYGNAIVPPLAAAFLRAVLGNAED